MKATDTSMYEAVLGLLGTALVSAIVWGSNLKSKSDVQAQRHEDLITLINTKFDGVGYKFDSLHSRLERVERKIYNGDNHHHD